MVAVTSEPGSVSLMCREDAGKNVETSASGTARRPQLAKLIKLLSSKFPRRRSRELFSGEQGMSVRIRNPDQGKANLEFAEAIPPSLPARVVGLASQVNPMNKDRGLGGTGAVSPGE